MVFNVTVFRLLAGHTALPHAEDLGAVVGVDFDEAESHFYGKCHFTVLCHGQLAFCGELVVIDVGNFVFVQNRRDLVGMAGDGDHVAIDGNFRLQIVNP